VSLTIRALLLLALGGCVQTSALGHELPDPEQAGDGDGDGDGGSEGSTTDSAWLDPEDGTSEGSETMGDDGIGLPASWDPPLGCGADPAEGLGCLPAAVTDCDLAYQPSWWRTADLHATRMWVAGVYETRSDHSFNDHPVGAATVHWSIAGSNVLVLSSYEPTHWTVLLEGEGALDHIIVTGYHAQSVTAPGDVPVDVYTLAASAVYACGYAVPGDGGGCEGEHLARFAQNVTGLPISGFDGCYTATNFRFGW
jgi:hypothetical protein